MSWSNILPEMLKNYQTNRRIFGIILTILNRRNKAKNVQNFLLHPI